MSDSFDYDVFIAYRDNDRPVAQKLAKRLRRDGLEVTWNKKKRTRARTLVLVMSRAAFGSEWPALKRQGQVFRDATNRKRRFVGLLIEDCDVPDPVAQLVRVDWRDRSDEGYRQLLIACGGTVTVKAAMVLQGHKDSVAGVAVTPDGKKIVSGSIDNTLKVWDLESGQCLATFEGHASGVWGVAVTPDGSKAVSGSTDMTLNVWDLESGQCLATLRGHPSSAPAVAVTPDGKRVVSGSSDKTLKVWDLESGRCLATLDGHGESIAEWDVAVTPDGEKAVSGSDDQTINVWDLESGRCLRTLEGHADAVYGVAVTADGESIVSGSSDKTLKVWCLQTGQCRATFEGHTSSVCQVAVTPDGKTVVSASFDRTLRAWDLETGRCLATFEGHTDSVWTVAVTPDGKRAVSGSTDGSIRIWDLPLAAARAAAPAVETRYTNAKVVLVGDSGVGKTGLAIRLVEDRWEVTDSTHGMNVWQLGLPGIEAEGMEREVWLWDFAGQVDYRLIHQLYMDETALAVMVIDPQRPDPFEPLAHWRRALESAVRHETGRLLVAGRCDRGGVTVSRAKLDRYCAAHGFAGFIDTSAKSGRGCEELIAAIAEHIPWDQLPWTATTRTFKALKGAILAVKEEGPALIRIAELRERLRTQLGEPVREEDLRAVVGLLGGQGVIRMLDFGDFVLLRPELINNYASAVVACAREHSEDIGCAGEREVLDAKIDFPADMKRLDEPDEKILLRAMLETFIGHSLCIREETPAGPQLVFPSYFKQDRPEIADHPNVFVTYAFSGVLDEIYATLVVRLHYTNDFEKDQLWRYAADFKTLCGRRVGLQMTKKSEASSAAEIRVYFEAGVPVDTQVSFIKYVHEHLLKRARDVTRVRSYVCPHCNTPLENRQAIRIRLEKGLRDILCGVCEKRVELIDAIERKFESDEFLLAVRKMDADAEINLDNESRELILVGHTFVTVGEAGHIFRPIANSDHGIDGEIEFKNDEGNASGRRVYLQLKHGNSYLYDRKRDQKEIFTIKNPRHAEYWQAHEYPVMLVIRTSNGRIRWMDVSEYLRDHGPETKQIVFDGEPFTADSVRKMRKQRLGGT